MFLYLLFALALAFGAGAVPTTTVKLDYGTFTGQKTNSYIAFRGVRYADAPTGALRWKQPVSPPTRQLGNVDATKYRNSCIQGGSTSVPSGQGEDCLFLNIWVSTKATTKTLPVVVWIHGGGLQGGSGQSEPEYFMNDSKEPIIFVGINYRLAQFGFLNSPDIHTNGNLNAGLLDQRAALRWVNKYISNFGGDPSRVTIWGQSAGGGSVMFQLVGNDGNNENLFHQAIGDSPSLSFTPNYDDARIQETYNKFLGHAGCGGASDKLACLRAADVNKVAAAGSQTTAEYPANIFLFAPVVGGVFLKTAPVEALEQGKFPKIRMLFGSNTDEGVGWSKGLRDSSANTSTPGATVDTVYNFLRGQYMNLSRDTFNKIAALYPSSSPVSQGQQMYGEARYICTANLIVAAATGHGQKAWHYRYDNPSGSTHGAELAAFFNKPTGGTSAQDNLFFHMRQYWTSFITGGEPHADNGVPWAQNPVSDAFGNTRLILHPGSAVIEKMPEQIKRCQAWHSTGLQMGV